MSPVTNFINERPAEALCALFNAAFVNGWCFENGHAQTVEQAGFSREGSLTAEEARQYLEKTGGDFRSSDIRGRWLGVNLNSESPCLNLYAEHFGVCPRAVLERAAQSTYEA